MGKELGKQFLKLHWSVVSSIHSTDEDDMSGK